MKVLFTIVLVLAAFMIGRNINSEQSGVWVVIDRHTTEKGLAEIIQKAKLVNINLTIDESGYDKEGRLKSIRGNVDFGDGGSGSFQSDRVGKIIIKKELNSVNADFSIVVKKRWI